MFPFRSLLVLATILSLFTPTFAALGSAHAAPSIGGGGPVGSAGIVQRPIGAVVDNEGVVTAITDIDVLFDLAAAQLDSGELQDLTVSLTPRGQDLFAEELQEQIELAMEMLELLAAHQAGADYAQDYADYGAYYSADEVAQMIANLQAFIDQMFEMAAVDSFAIIAGFTVYLVALGYAVYATSAEGTGDRPRTESEANIIEALSGGCGGIGHPCGSSSSTEGEPEETGTGGNGVFMPPIDWQYFGVNHAMEAELTFVELQLRQVLFPVWQFNAFVGG